MTKEEPLAMADPKCHCNRSPPYDCISDAFFKAGAIRPAIRTPPKNWSRFGGMLKVAGMSIHKGFHDEIAHDHAHTGSGHTYDCFHAKNVASAFSGYEPGSY